MNQSIYTKKGFLSQFTGELVTQLNDNRTKKQILYKAQNQSYKVFSQFCYESKEQTYYTGIQTFQGIT